MGEAPHSFDDYSQKVKCLRQGILGRSSNFLELKNESMRSSVSPVNLVDNYCHFPMCLHEHNELPVLYFNERLNKISSDLFEKELFQTEKGSCDFGGLFSPLESPLTISDRTTPESVYLCSRMSPVYQIGNSFPPKRKSSLWCDVVIDLKYEVIHKYFSLLLEWAKDALTFTSSASQCSQLLLYEDMYSAFPLDEDCLFSAWDSKTEVTIHDSLSKDSFLLLVQGTSSEAVNDRAATIDRMIDDALKVYKIHELVGWTEKHCEALIGSDCLRQMQNATRACVLFRNQASFSSSTTTTNAEVAALQPYQCNALIKALDLLHPTTRVCETFYELFLSCVPWTKLKAQYNVSTTFNTNTNDHKTIGYGKLTLWGFEGFIDNAFEEVQKIVCASGITTAQQLICPIPLNPWHSGMSLATALTTAPTHLQSVNNSSNNKSEGHTSPIQKNFMGSYSFRDREAGIFYFAFEKQFHAYIQITFSVVIMEEDFKECKSDIEDGNRNAILKLSFYGSTQLSVSSTRAYLDQLNPHNLYRIQLFYPMISLMKYKELLTRRSMEMSTLSDVRHSCLLKLGSNLASHPNIDPMQFMGAINIRIKPPIHSSGLNRMPFPSDCTVTICGSVLVKEHTDVIAAIEKRFNDIPSEHFVEVITLPFGHPLKKQLTVKTSRDDFIKEHDLMGLKWDEGSRNNGSVGMAKIWASSKSILNSALHAINEVTRLWAASTIPGIDESEHWPPLTKDEVDTSSKSILEWPTAALRYALLSDPLSSELSNLLKKWTEGGVACKYPYRDRTNPNAGILLQGVADKVTLATTEVADFLQYSAKAMMCVLIVVPHHVYASLIAKDLTGVKLIQGQAGVHMGMNVSLEDIHQEAQSMIDLRLTSTRNCLLSMRVDNANAHHSLDIIVVASASVDVGLSWGAKHELVILDGTESSVVYSQRDEEQLANGRIQIHTDSKCCKTTLRVMLIKQDSDSRSPPDFEANVNRIVKGLEKADSLSLKGLSIVMPHSICSIGVAAVVKFARKCYSIHSLSRIVCIEKLAHDDVQLQHPLVSGGGSYVCEAMLKLIEEKQRVSNSNITLLTANTPVPLQLKVSPFGQQLSRYSQTPRSASGAFPTVSMSAGKWSGDQSVLVKGIESSVLKALDSLKDLMKGNRNV